MNSALPRRFPLLSLAAWLVVAAGCGDKSAPAPPAQETSPIPARRLSAAQVDGERLRQPDREPHNWLTHGRDWGEQRFSPLDQVNDANAGRLGLAWWLPLDTTYGVQSTPLVVDGVMYLSSVWNVIHAVDAATGREIWRYDPKTRRDWLRRACCGPTNRGLAVWNGKLYEGTLDGRLIAVDAAAGTLVWEVLTIDPEQDYSISGAPRTVNGKVIIGNGGAEYGVRGYVTAYDAETGKQLWRFHTVPGNPADGFENSAMERAAKTWSGEWWRYGGGGTAWDAFAFDPELNLLYIGTGNGGPWPHALRSPGGGDNLFLSSIVAVNADTGEYVWHFQTTPGENWDYTATQSLILADLEIDGAVRKVIMQLPKNGFYYVLDRATGEFLSARNVVPVNWASGLDPETGRPRITEENLYDRAAKLITPGPSGAHNWQPMSFSPRTGLAYIPLQETSYVYSMTRDFRPMKGQWNMGNDPGAARPPEAARAVATGALLAWDPVRQAAAWRVELAAPWNGGTLATAGNLVFQGAADGRFVGYRAETGEKLWEMPIQTGAVAGPVSYSVNGEQYIAVAAGWAGAIALWGGDRERARRPPVEARVLAFKLDGRAVLPPPPLMKEMPKPPPSTAGEGMISRGSEMYAATCATCHGVNAIAGIMPDLRYMTAETHAQFADIVLRGTRIGGGMAAFADKYSQEDVEAIHAWLIRRANEDYRDLQRNDAGAN